MRDNFQNRTINRIVFCRLGGIGDVIHTLPLVQYIRNKYPTSSIEYITSHNVKELLDGCCSFIDKVWVYEKHNEKPLGNNFLKCPALNLINYFFNLHGNLRFFLFNLFFVKSKRYFHYKKDKSIHAVVNFARTYDKSISVFSLDRQVLHVNESQEILKENNLKKNRYVCFVPGVGYLRPHRAWSFENWIKLTKKILTGGNDFKVVFLGGEYESAIFENWIKLAKDVNVYENDRVISLMGKLSLFETTQVISNSSFLVSCDTGLLHIASGLGVRTIGLYGPTLPERTGPFSSESKIFRAKDCNCVNNVFDTKKCKKTSEGAGYCMNSLSVDEIFSELCKDVIIY